MLKTLSFLCFALLIFISSCSDDPDSVVDPDIPPIEEVPDINPDINEDGKLNILVLGTSKSINNSSGAFASENIASELENILSQDEGFDLEVNISFEDIYRSKVVTFGLGQGGTELDYSFFSHSLTQYYYWPEQLTERHENLSGQGDFKWDYVVIGADPYILAKTPGYYSLGVNKIAAKVVEGGAKPLLIMLWPKDESIASIDHFAEFTRRTADGAKVTVETIPAARAWDALPSGKKDSETKHPSPNGAYLTAASVYAQILNKSASNSAYQYDDEIADIAFKAKTDEEAIADFTEERSFVSPFKSCDIADSQLNYNHTGSSSENGILAGLRTAIGQSDRTLEKNGTPPINFNYGRANTNFEADKRYDIDPAKFDFSLGFPMQDNGNHGNTSMLYGLDKRLSESNNGTDLGTALYMVRNSELPHARAIPIRTLYAQMKEAISTQSAYRDNWHMHRDLDKAIGTYMYTLLTGECALGREPTDTSSDAWKTWMSQKIGYETAYNLMHLKGIAPGCD